MKQRNNPDPRTGHMFIVGHLVVTFDHLVVAPFIYTLYYKHTIPLGLVSFIQIALYVFKASSFDV